MLQNREPLRYLETFKNKFTCKDTYNSRVNVSLTIRTYPLDERPIQ